MDTHAVRALAHQARQTGTRLRDEATVLEHRVAQVRWRGVAAGALRTRVDALGLDLVAAAALHDDAATALEVHAVAVDEAAAAALAVVEHAAEAAAACGSPLGALAAGVLS